MQFSDNWDENRRICEERRKKQQEHKSNKSKERLERALKKRMTTTMIGALDKFEKAFGYLWGSEKDDNEKLTKDEQDNWRIWGQIRKQVLDGGNNQLRSMLRDLENYEVDFKGYYVEFKRTTQEDW